MTKAEIESLIEKAKAATQDSAQWNTEEPASNEWKNNKINNAAFIRVANPSAIQTLAQNYLDAIEVIKKLQKYVAFNGDTWVQDECNNFLKKVGCE